MPELGEWEGKVAISEEVGNWDGGGQDQYFPEEQYWHSDEKIQGYYGYDDQAGRGIPPLVSLLHFPLYYQ